MKKDMYTTNVFIKECIAQALSKLIESKHLSDIKITELARIAGVSRMSYYRNFKSKEEIFSSYFDIILTRYDEAEGYSQPFGIYHDMKHMIHYLGIFICCCKQRLWKYFSCCNDKLYCQKMVER